MLELGREKYGDHNIKVGSGEELPHKDKFFDGVMAECTMSLMDDFKRTISESNRVLKDRGYFIISDIYARRPEYLDEVQKYNINSCLRGLFHIEILKEAIEESGFKIVLFEDWTDLLKQLMVKIIFKYGSMSVFWNVATCSNCGDFQKNLPFVNQDIFYL